MAKSMMGKKRVMLRNSCICTLLFTYGLSINVHAFCTSKRSSSQTRGLVTSNTVPNLFSETAVVARRIKASNNDDDENENDGIEMNRRDAIMSTLISLSTITSTATTLMHPNAANADIEGVVAAPTPSTPTASTGTEGGKGGGVTLFTTKSGLKYIDIKEGTGPTPKYGQLCSISYKAYVKLPDSVSADKNLPTKPQEFDSDNAFLIKHGNGRILPGLDEGLHSLRVGGKRRIIIPPKLGFVANGLGPLPETPWGRAKLNKLLNQMVEVRGGNLVFDVELKSVFDDEADQGYYDDGSLSPEEFQTLRNNLERGAREAREQQKVAAGIGEV